MVRTKGDINARAVAAKAPRKAINTRITESNMDPFNVKGKKVKSAGMGNVYCPRETPYWQKNITNFFPRERQLDSCDDGSSSSTATSENNIAAVAEETSGAPQGAVAEGTSQAAVAEETSGAPQAAVAEENLTSMLPP